MAQADVRWGEGAPEGTVRPVRETSADGVGGGGRGGAPDGAAGAGDTQEEWIEVDEIARLIGRRRRTAYDLMAERPGKPARIPTAMHHGRKMARRGQVLRYVRRRDALHGPARSGAAPPAEPAELEPEPAVRPGPTVARMLLGPEPHPEALASMTAEVLEYRANIERLPPHTRVLLARTYFRAVKKAVAQMEQYFPGLLAAVLAAPALGA